MLYLLHTPHHQQSNTKLSYLPYHIQKVMVRVLSPAERTNALYKVYDETLKKYMNIHPDAHLK
ncbi:TPA: hypothetical protein ACPSKY_002285 [Legionella bozemanae]